MNAALYVWMIWMLAGCGMPSDSSPQAGHQREAMETPVKSQPMRSLPIEQQKQGPLNESQEPSLQRQGRCVRDSIGKTICAPAGGSARIDRLGQVVCGLGQCVNNALGEVSCASQAGGEVMMDSAGQAVCVGGCVEARASYCQASR